MTLLKHAFFMCILLFGIHSQSWSANIKDIRIGNKEGFTRIVFDLDEKPSIYNVKYMTSPERITLDFTDGNINKRAIKSTSAYPLIKNITGTNIRNNGMSVEIELNDSANFKHFILPPVKNAGYRLVLDITKGKHRFTNKYQTIIPDAPKPKIIPSKIQNNITDYKSDAIDIYDNSVLTDATLDKLFQPFLGNTQLKETYDINAVSKDKTSVQQQVKEIITKKVTDNSPKFNIRGYKIIGNTLLPLDKLTKIIQPFVGKIKTFSDVQHALEALELGYQSLGYGMVQIYLPEQELNKGIVIFKVIEPVISTIKVQGASYYDLQNIQKSIISLIKGKTPNTKDISRNLSLVNENPAKKTSVEFLASDEDGYLNTLIKVNDKKPSSFSLTLDNTGTESTGELRAGFAYQHANITNHDDVLSFQYTTSEKSSALNAYSLGYHLPLYRLNSSIDIFAGYSKVDSGVIQNIYKVSGKGKVFGARYNHILAKINNYTHRLSYGLDYRSYDTDAILLSGGGSIVPDIKVQPISLTYSGQWTSQGKATGFNIQVHNNIFSSEKDEAEFNASRIGAKANYTIFRFGLEHAQAFAKSWQMRFSVTGQHTSNALISGEQFGAGGANSVRGYNERDVSSDKGIQATAEIYTPNFANSVGLKGDMRSLFFLDTAHLSRNSPQPGELTSYSISSFGAGIRLIYKDNLTFKLDVASPLKSTLTQEKGKYKVHAALKYTF